MSEEGYFSIFSEDNAFEEEPEERVISRELHKAERDEPSMRPTSWDEYYGQDKIKSNLEVFIKAALSRGEALDHVLLYGPPGLGKTTLAAIIANELGVSLKMTSGPAIERQGDLAAMLTNLQAHDVLFIDEIHRLNHAVEEVLYPAMEDYALDIMIGKGPSARSIRLDLPPFTLIGATTRAGLLTSPLRDRFGMNCRLELYQPKDIAQILQRNANVLKIGISDEGLKIISGRCRGTPRIAIRILRRLRDFAQVMGKDCIDADIAEKGLAALEIDHLGLDATDLTLMRKMAELFNGGPVGLDTLAAITGEDPRTIEDIYEPYLMQIGYISKTPRGRMLSEAAFKHLGIPWPGPDKTAEPPADAEGSRGKQISFEETQE
ncbi:MAG: Holliday junction branch migration DNA helicase RuvB [Clostridiales bacterium]|nr:Holliday junction branch migration DNA helicase RuvB [Clostridiales bacterium]MDD7432979.1 Holliday junction branch migration DNA helicase RuvB [Clostridiales bacterium]MDY3061930.1 Holliday junction branch migration DNA helicase RuvB [Eubacteriales bacterium]